MSELLKESGNANRSKWLILPKHVSVLFRILIPFAILMIGGVAWYFQISNKVEKAPPQPSKRAAVETAVQVLERQDYQVKILTQGSVQAQNETGITAGVSGRVLSTAPAFEAGAFFKKGDVLLRLDDADLKSAVANAEAALARAESELLQEDSRARQALLNWQDLGYSEEPTDLVLRKPQMKQAEASVKSAQASLEQALRNLTRAIVRAPYNGRTIERAVSVGQSINQATSLGTVFSTDYAEVRLPLNAIQLDAISLPETSEDAPLPVTLTVTRAGISHERKASVVRTEGVLDEVTKELFVIASVEDPFGLESDSAPLRIGQPVRAEILGKTIKDVFVIERQYLRSLDEIIIIEAETETIQRRIVDPIWSTPDTLVIRDGITSGELMAISLLTYAPEGGKVEIVEQESPIPQNAATPTLASPGA